MSAAPIMVVVIRSAIIQMEGITVNVDMAMFWISMADHAKVCGDEILNYQVKYITVSVLLENHGIG